MLICFIVRIEVWFDNRKQNIVKQWTINLQEMLAVKNTSHWIDVTNFFCRAFK